MYFNSSFYNCTKINSEFEIGGAWIDANEGLVLPIGPGLTKYMADKRNPADETAYRELSVYTYLHTIIHKTPYYLVKYEHMKVCACVYTCGVNGFKYAMLWKQYLKTIFSISSSNIFLFCSFIRLSRLFSFT